ncbi:SIMPL domain-containing protein [Halomicrobium sp. IBSBa]|uniref:SIMPL domain-containing protein n=1 Tax=Halomicrobium sp. IBSBa TaxID=2778916 RepID=UPI001ABFD9A5|nr:SIMPL domain-containing protein [Halomicrobium sp. IBSBa]MBO4249407.1 SIMPL domain-containing protein [Halomicrobium sp. IBSBa]
MRRSIPAIAVLATLVLLSGCTGALGAGDSAQTAATDNRTVDVGATGAVSAQPDQAVVRVGVETRAGDAATARQQLADNVTQLRDALADVEGAQVRTNGYDIGQDYRRPPSEEEDPEPRYVARQSFEITINDTDKAGAVIDTAVANGANNVDNVEFTLSADRRDELEEQALEGAMDRARTKATTVAERADLTIEGVETVTTVDRGYRPYAAEMTATAATDGASTDIDSGPVTVTAQVQVTYEAAESA